MDENSNWIARRLTVDFVMSACALLISAVACATSLYQLRNASLMMSAQTWPYITAGWHFDNDESGILVTNDGQGPAIVRMVVLKLDGRPQHDVVSALRQIVSGTTGSVQIDALLHGSVIPPGQTLRLLNVHGAAWDKQLRAAKDRIGVELCYCSILKQCWRNVLGELPQAIERCDDTSGLVIPQLN